MKHTAGPWEWHIKDGGLDNLVANPPNVSVKNIVVVQHGYCQLDADAALIAAAPDLLAACYKAAQFIINGVGFGYILMPDEGDTALETLPALRAAIAKATGE